MCPQTVNLLFDCILICQQPYMALYVELTAWFKYQMDTELKNVNTLTQIMNTLHFQVFLSLT